MIFSKSSIKACLEESKPLLQKHWDEISHYKDIPLDPDYDQYLKLEELGITRMFSARTKEGMLVGYALFLIRPHIHYKTCIMAYQDIIFIDPSRRGIGMFFIQFCDEELKKEGINVVSQHVKNKFNFGPMLEKIGYELMDLIYVRRLN